MTEDHKPLPVHGYTPQSDAKVALVNSFKVDEERLLRKLETLDKTFDPVDEPGLDQTYEARYDRRWLAVARTHFQEGFMALNRAVFQPQRIKLPEDDDNPPGRQTSPEIASLAGKYLELDDDAWDTLLQATSLRRAFAADIRKLAASALGQVNE